MLSYSLKCSPVTGCKNMFDLKLHLPCWASVLWALHPSTGYEFASVHVLLCEWEYSKILINIQKCCAGTKSNWLHFRCRLHLRISINFICFEEQSFVCTIRPFCATCGLEIYKCRSITSIDKCDYILSLAFTSQLILLWIKDFLPPVEVCTL